MGLIEAGNADAMLYSLWSRNRIQGLGALGAVSGRAERIYCGHTPTRRTVQLENVCYIDTGAVYAGEGYRNARLTMMEIHPRPQVEFAVFTPDQLEVARVDWPDAAPILHQLRNKAINGTPNPRACRHTVSDCGSTPATASNTTTPPSRTRRLRCTSAVKSMCPGVSTMLI